jgi:hypothetical protein
MAKAGADRNANPGHEAKPRPYPPSWVDRFNAWAHRQTGPSWLYYLGIGLALFSIQTGVLLAEGVRPIGPFLAPHAFLSSMIVFFPALLHYLDNMAETALADLRPALKTDEEAYAALRYRLTTLPPLPTLLASAISAITVVLITESLGAPAGFNALADYPISSGLIYATYVIVWWVWGAFVYHTIHQLRLINHIYTQHTRVNLFRTRLLYAFSSTTAVTAVSLTIPTYAWLAINQSMRDPNAIGITLPITALALVAFFWPQLGARRLLAQEKWHKLDELSLRFEALIDELRQRVDSRNLEEIDDLKKLIAALEIEETALKSVSTWPWQPETLRYLMTALLLPLALWLVQYFLQRLLGL